MKLIRILDRRKSLTAFNFISWGLFYCSFCKIYVEKQLSNGLIAKSCGCQQHAKKHGETGVRLYRIWQNIKNRCFYISNTNYQYYGGRGITICPEWINDYIKFRDWSLNNGYKDSLEIDRINTNGNYEPNNCQWITQTENKQKLRTTKLSLKKANEIRELHKTGNYIQKELAEKYNVSTMTIFNIIKNKIWKNT